MKLRSFLLFFVLLLSYVGKCQHISYTFSAPNAAHHEAEISLLAEHIGNNPAVFRMSRSSPGRYATHEFGKNVYNVRAEDANGHELAVTKADADVYMVKGHGGTVKLSYTLYGNYADGTYASIDKTNYHLNMPATFMWLKGFDEAPITVRFNMPEKWKIATQLAPTEEAHTFTARGLQLFMDAPVKMGKLHFSDWQEANPGKTFRFRLALEAQATQGSTDSFAKKIKRISEEARKVFGEYPDYDNGMYTFIASINPYVRGDGMEHRNSTMICMSMGFSDTNSNLLGVFAHEFFHCWNVERIRPRSLEPFNFEKSNMSEGLWLAEGFTSYYGELIMVRAGFSTPERFMGKLEGAINIKEMRPGARYYSPIENSQRAVFTDAGIAVDRTNYPNMYASYYPYGGAIAIALDLELRSRFNKTLDEFMRALWQKFGKTEVPYTMQGVQDVLAGVTDEKYAATFFSRYIYGHESINYNTLMATVGYTLRATSESTWIGELGNGSDKKEDTGFVLTGNTVRGTPLYNAGLDINDEIMELDGYGVRTLEDMTKILHRGKPGKGMSIIYKHHGKTTCATITPDTDRSITIKDKRDTDELTPEQLAARKKWLGVQ